MTARPTTTVAHPVLTSSTMTPKPAPPGVPPPQQARSRAALQSLLAAAEHVLVTDGLDDFTINAVAEQAGVSVGGVYRRFTGKEQLIDAVRDRLLAALEDNITAALEAAQPTLAGTIAAFTHALGDTFARSGKIAPALLSGQRTAAALQRGLATMTALQRRFLDEATNYRDDIRRSQPASALELTLRTIIAAGVHRAAIAQMWPDGRTWPQWADEITDMSMAYLTAPQVPSTSAP